MVPRNYGYGKKMDCSLPISSISPLNSFFNVVPDDIQAEPTLFSGKIEDREKILATFKLKLVKEKPFIFSCGAGECRSIGSLEDITEKAIDTALSDLINHIDRLVKSKNFCPCDCESFHELCYSSLQPQESNVEDSFEVIEDQGNRIAPSAPPLSDQSLYPDLNQL